MCYCGRMDSVAASPTSALSLTAFVAAHPEWSAERAGRRWAARTYSAWDAGEEVAPAILTELAERYPLFAPDPLAAQDVLLERYAPLITQKLDIEIWRCAREHQTEVRKLEFKRIKSDSAKEAALYADLTARHEQLEALRDEAYQRTLGRRDGQFAQAWLPRLVAARAAARRVPEPSAAQSTEWSKA